MTQQQDHHEALEQLLSRTLRELPPRPAPSTLESRVWNELARRAALPWWHRHLAQWPLFARAGFFLTCAAAIRFAFFAGHWLIATVTSLNAAGTPAASWVRNAASAFLTLGELASALARAVPQSWLLSGLALIAVLYVVLFGLGAVAYRTLYLDARLHG